MQHAQFAPQSIQRHAIGGLQLLQELDELLTRIYLVFKLSIQAVKKNDCYGGGRIGTVLQLIRKYVDWQRLLILLWRKRAGSLFGEKLDLLRLAAIENDKVILSKSRNGLVLFARHNHADLHQPGGYAQNRLRRFRGQMQGWILYNGLRDEAKRDECCNRRL